MLIGVFIGAKLFTGDSGYFTNLYTEVLSITITIVVLNRLAQNREERRSEQTDKERLIRAAGSSSHDTAISAVEEIRKREWLAGEKGILKGADLRSTNLQSAILEDANLQGVNLGFANLQNANLASANLQSADLFGTNLQGAKLYGAKLHGVNLFGANLQGAKLYGAKLHGANLEEVNFQGADISGARFNETTTLPDGSTWTPEIDLTHFTNPHHPNFWHSDYDLRLTYRGKTQDADTP